MVLFGQDIKKPKNTNSQNPEYNKTNNNNEFLTAAIKGNLSTLIPLGSKSVPHTHISAEKK